MPHLTPPWAYRITAVIPAHNEESTVAKTVRSLKEQTVPPHRVLVVSDNSMDDTVAVAAGAGAEVMETVGNSARKAGALNQALGYLTASMGAGDLVLVMDADTVMVPAWIQRALPELDTPKVGAVGAVFQADTDRGMLAGCQAREWFRFSEELAYKQRTFVLSGTAALIRWEALQDVHRAHGHYYHPDAITEDFQATIDLLAAGWELRSPAQCRTVTETMPTWGDLFNQRTRWSLGALQCVTRAGLTGVTAVYWRQQVMLALAILVGVAAYSLTVVGAATHGLAFSWVSLVILGAFWVERVTTVWPMGWRHRATAALMLPELVYAAVLQAAHLKAIYQKATGSRGTWSHVGGTQS